MTASRAPLRPNVTRPVPHQVPKVRAQPKPTNQAKLLQQLQLIQNISVVSALLLTGCVFVLYGWTVVSQKRWNQQYSKLEYLKQMEGKLINAAEALDHDRLQRAWAEGNNLVRETPDRVIFIEAMPPRQPLPSAPPAPEPDSSLPIAY